MPITYKDEVVPAKPAGSRAVRGKEGEPKKGEPGYVPNIVATAAREEYTYKVAKISLLDGDESGENTFIEVFQSPLINNNYRNALKFIEKGVNYFAKKRSAPKTDNKQLKALRVLADTLGLTLEETKAKLGIV